MHFYYFRAIKNYKNVFKLIYITKIKRFNSRFYFYCIDNGINPLTVMVDPNKLLPVITKRQSHVELLEEL